MKRTCTAEKTTAVSVEEYLGFAICDGPSGYTAAPLGWAGPDLFAGSLPLIRKRIWFWWHQVDGAA